MSNSQYYDNRFYVRFIKIQITYNPIHCLYDISCPFYANNISTIISFDKSYILGAWFHIMIIISVLQWNEISMSTFILYESINLISYVHDDIIVLFFSVTFWWIRNRDNGNAMKNYHTVKFQHRNQHWYMMVWNIWSSKDNVCFISIYDNTADVAVIYLACLPTEKYFMIW